MTKNTAINFMLFSYFGLTEKEYDNVEALISAAINKAYVDMASHVLRFHFIKDSALTDEEKEMIKHIYKRNGANIIKTAIEENVDDFRKWHNKVARELNNLYDNYLRYREYNVIEKVDFSFGRAQKWINMTIKYLYILDVIISDVNNEESKLRKVCEKFEKPDAPVDGYIIQGAIKEKDVDVQVRKLPWSSWNWTDEDKYECKYYEEFQKKLESKCNNEHILDFENALWIKMAKTAKCNEKKKIDEKVKNLEKRIVNIEEKV